MGTLVIIWGWGGQMKKINWLTNLIKTKIFGYFSYHLGDLVGGRWKKLTCWQIWYRQRSLGTLVIIWGIGGGGGQMIKINWLTNLIKTKIFGYFSYHLGYWGQMKKINLLTNLIKTKIFGYFSYHLGDLGGQMKKINWLTNLIKTKIFGYFSYHLGDGVGRWRKLTGWQIW